MHGGPPATLAARLLDRWQNDDDRWCLTRLTVELLRPVPLAPLHVSISPRRSGKRIEVLDAVVTDQHDIEVLADRGLRVANVDNGIDETSLPHPAPVDVPPPERCERWSRDSGRATGESFSDAMDVRLIHGRPFDELRPAHVWLRLGVPIFAGEDIHPLDRLVVAGDYANGMSNVVSFASHRYINADLTAAIHRYPDGDWISLDATTHARRAGHGTAIGVLSDRNGCVATGIQSLVIDAG
jgi:hypothetical protein